LKNDDVIVSTYHHQNTKSIIFQRDTCIFQEIIRKYDRLLKYLFLLELFLLEIKVLDVKTQILKILTSITKHQYHKSTKTHGGTPSTECGSMQAEHVPTW